MKKSICVLLSLSASVSLAAKPASTADVDAAAARLQTQIDVLKSIPAVAHPVGSCYGGGVVYYVNSDANAPAGQRGLIAAPTDASSGAVWEQGGTTSITTLKTYFTGESNTNTILATSPGTFPAATAAKDYTVAGDTCAECTSWYLPSQNELATLYAQSTSSIALGDTNFWSACGGMTPVSTIYWSSTQNDASTAFFVNFLSGFVITAPTGGTSSFRVRAVRAF